MKKKHVILVADRNPRVLDFLRRELHADGHRVLPAETAEALGRWIRRPEQLDALVIDPNMPGLDSAADLVALLSPRPELPVVFHCQAWDRPFAEALRPTWVFVEKNGPSVEMVRRHVMQLLARHETPG